MNVTVVYNGTDCVVKIERLETVEVIEYIEANFTNEIFVEQTVTIGDNSTSNETIYVQEKLKDLKSGERMTQYSLTALSASVFVGITIYVSLELIRSCREN